MGISEVAIVGIAFFTLIVVLPAVAAVYAMLMRAACQTYNYVWGLKPPVPVWQRYQTEPEIPEASVALPPLKQSDNPFATPIAAPAPRQPLDGTDGVPVPGFWKAFGIIAVMVLISFVANLLQNTLPPAIVIDVASSIAQFLITAGIVSAMLPTSYLRALAVTFFWLAFVFVIVIGVVAVGAIFFMFAS